MTQIKELGDRLWDVADFVKPAQVGASVLSPGADTPETTVAAHVCKRGMCCQTG